jgi:hypothetical protein
MLGKRFLTISILLPLVAISATAHAASTITDKSYWPSAARPAVHGQASTAQNGPRDAYASASAWDYRYPGSPRAQIGGEGRYYSGYSAPAGR